MNWYKISQQQYLWDNDPQLANANVDRSSLEISGDMESDIVECQGLSELQAILYNYGIQDIDEVVFEKTNEKIWTFNYNEKLHVVELSFPYPSFSEAEEWIYSISNDAWQYVDQSDFNEEFWEGIGAGATVYHGTHEDRIEDIKVEGIAPMDETRGINNRSTGAAVFTSPTPEMAADAYAVVLEINVGQMKADGHMPSVSKEEPIDEAETLQLLAHKIGLENFYADYEQGLDPETVIFYGSIPPKYLRVVE